jgi:GNAT superfamily N-acetyltransferase
MKDGWPMDPFVALATAFAGLVAATPGFTLASIGRPGALVCAVSPIPIGAFNRVMGVRLADDDAEPAIQAVKAAHAAAGVPGSWWLDPDATPRRLSASLERHGYRSQGTVPAMSIPLHDLQPVHLPPGAALSWVRGRDEMREAQRMVGRGFGMPPAFVDEMADRMALIGDAPDGPIRVIVARLDGLPVASAMAATIGNVVGVYSVMTLPEARGKGLGAAVTLAVLHDARDRGAHMGVLEATEMGFPVYERIGFRHVGDFRMFASA